MKYLLDTNICVYWLNGNQNIEQKAIQVGLSQIAISFITLSELYYGAYKSQKVQKNLNSIKPWKTGCQGLIQTGKYVKPLAN